MKRTKAFRTSSLFVAAVSLLLLPLGLKAEAPIHISGLVEPAVREQLRADLRFLDEIKGQSATPIFREIFGGVLDGRVISDFLSVRVKTIDSDDCGNPLMAACVIHSLSRSTLFVTDGYSKFDMPQVLRASILLHESRHTEKENGFWLHSYCPKPFRDWQGKQVVSIVTGAKLDGQQACDRSAYGAYATQAEFLKNTQLFCENCSEKVKMDAGLYGEDAVRRITDPGANLKVRTDLNI